MACFNGCAFSPQVLRLLEDVGLPELVIQLATLAITEAVGDVSSQVRCGGLTAACRHAVGA